MYSDTMKNDVLGQLAALKSWQPPQIPASIPHGDMPGDKINIDEGHIHKANVIFPALIGPLTEALQQSRCQRAVLTVCGGSGVGKSEIASLLSFYLRQNGVGSYTLSGDNYPHRIPRCNDEERLRIFRCGGTGGLVTSGQYTPGRADELRTLQQQEKDADPALVAEKPWLGVYQREGRNSLKAYLGTPQEQDFAQLTNIVGAFKNGADKIWLKRMGREVTDLWYEEVDMTDTHVLVVEWTHGNSDYYQGVDIPILLNSTPQETMLYRRLRGRDGKTDSPFTTMVLEVEQGLLEAQAKKARIIVAKDGTLLSYADYRRQMANGGGN